jgi:hypothetical protein
VKIVQVGQQSTQVSGKKRTDHGKHGVRLLLGLKMAAGNGPSFDL